MLDQSSHSKEEIKFLNEKLASQQKMLVQAVSEMAEQNSQLEKALNEIEAQKSELSTLNEMLESQRNMLAEAVEELTEKNRVLQIAMEEIEQRREELSPISYRTYHDIRGPLVSIQGLAPVTSATTI